MRMNGKQTDRRVIRTKKEILNALTTLLEQKTIDEITVKEVTDVAGINRGTFYLHYVDKYDLMEKSINQLILEMREIGSTIIALAVKSNGMDNVREEVEQGLVALFEYIQEHHRFIRSLTSENSNYSFHLKFNELLKDTFVDRIKSVRSDIPAVYVVSALSYAIQGIVQTWLHEGMKEKPEKMAEYSYEILYRHLNAYLK